MIKLVSQKIVVGTGTKRRRMMNSVILLAASLFGLSTATYAAGPNRPQPAPGNSALKTPNPVRAIEVAPVGTRVFQLPNGERVDLSADLNTILRTSVISNSQFVPRSAGPQGACERRLKLKATVTNFEFEVARLGIRFGYNNRAGELDTTSDLEGRVGVRVGTISMDFEVQECRTDRCDSHIATYETHLTSGVDLNFELDLDQMKGGASFVFNSSLASIVRSMMDKAVLKLGRSPDLHELTWMASVKMVDPEAGTLIFDKGSQQRLERNQTFVVYAPVEGENSCIPFRAVAHVHTDRVDTVSSLAIIDAALDQRAPAPGDLIMIRRAD